MKDKNIYVPHDVSICFVGDIHEHDEHFYKLLDLWNPSEKRWLVSVGDIYDKGFGTDSGNKIIRTFIDLNKNGIGFIVKGNHELKRVKKERRNGLSNELQWVSTQPLSLTFEFKKGKKVVAVHAGVTPNMKQDDLLRNIEVCFVRDVDQEGDMIRIEAIEVEGKRVYRNKKEGGVNWHKKYDGRFGYIVSGHAPNEDGPLYFNNSCNLDTKVFETGILSAQVFSSNGNLSDKIKITGKPFSPK
jgi:predicted phosphodiesterase